MHSRSVWELAHGTAAVQSTWSTACAVADPGAENMGWDIERGVPLTPEFIYIVDLEMGTLVLTHGGNCHTTKTLWG